MSQRSTRLLALALAFGLFGCPLLKKKSTDAGAEEDIADAATVTVTGTGAKNEKDVLRYAKEEKLSDEPATIAKDGTKPKTYPGLGQDVATLSKGTAVVKIAKYFSTGVLITFDDPAGGGKLMGWIPPESLAATATGASAGQKPVAVPTTVTPTTSHDAGAAPHADAGGPVAAVDAGAPAPAKYLLSGPPGADGKCPVGFDKASDAQCHKSCSADGDCPRNTFCKAMLGKKYCSATK